MAENQLGNGEMIKEINKLKQMKDYSIANLEQLKLNLPVVKIRFKKMV
jgi:hypothetical protein